MTIEFLKKAKNILKTSNEIAEEDIEETFCSFARMKNCRSLKLILLNLRGFPDRTILCPAGRVLFIEFKKKGKKLTPTQKPWKRIIEGLDFQYHVCDEIGQGEKLLMEFLKRD